MKAVRTYLEEHDLDDLFAYNTTKVVKIRDRYLGWLHLLFRVGILAYIIGFVILHERLYLAMDSPLSAIRVQVVDPETGPKSLDTLSYCQQNPSSKSGYDCQYMQADDIRFPPDSSSGIFITTCVTAATQKTQCQATEKTCTSPWVQDGKNVTQLVANVGDFLLKIDHSVRAPKWYRDTIGSADFSKVPDHVKYSVAGSSRTLKGRLVDTKGKVVKQLNAKNSPDYISMNEMLHAGGITSLDHKSLDPVSDETIRFDGMILVVEIYYHNKYTPGNIIEYDYHVEVVPETKYNVLEKIYITYPSKRIVRDRHGIRVFFAAAGGIYQFNFQIALVQMTASLSLLAIASSVVDILALYIMPQKAHYQACKWQKSADFSDLRDRIDEQKKADTRVRQRRTEVASKYGRTS